MKKMRFVFAAMAAALAVAAQGFAEGKQEAPKSTGPMKISWLGQNTRGQLLQKDSPVELYLEQKLNVEFEPWYDMDFYQTEQIRVRLASGDIPDFMYTPGALSSFKELGIIREITPEAIRKNMPRLLPIMEKIAPETLWIRSTIDGKNYGIPQVLSISAAGPMIAIRDDWMKAVGAAKAPATLAELEDLYLKFRNNDPDGNGKKDSYALGIFKTQNETVVTASHFSQEFGAFGVTLNDWTKKGDRVEWSMVSPEYKEALKLLARWYKMEIIDPEFVTDLRKETNAKFANGQLGAFEDFSSWTSEQPGGPVHAVKQVKPDVGFTYVISPVGPGGKRGTPSRDASFNPSAVGKQVSDEKLAKILSIIDTLVTDPELFAVTSFGIKDTHWKYDAKGFVDVIPPYNDAKEQSKIGTGYWRFQTVHEGNEKLYMPAFRYPAHRFAMDKQVALPLGYLPVMDSANATIGQNLARLEGEFFVKGIIGAVDIDKEWDAYLARWKSAGGESLTSYVNAQYKASLQKK